MNTFEYSASIYGIIHHTLPADAPEMPEMAPVLAMFLERFLPGKIGDSNIVRMTSSDIVRILENSCTISPSEVAKVMVYLGYELDVNSTFDCAWLLIPDEDFQDRTGHL